MSQVGQQVERSSRWSNMDKNGETVLLISGGSVEIFPGNTLRCFRNRIKTLPRAVKDDGRRFAVALQEIGVSNEFACIQFRPGSPAIICLPDGEKFDMTKQDRHFYFEPNTRSLDGPQLNYELERAQNHFAPIVDIAWSRRVNTNKNGIEQVVYHLGLKALVKCCLYIEKTFAENFGIDKDRRFVIEPQGSANYCKIALDAKARWARAVTEYDLIGRQLPKELDVESSIISQDQNTAHRSLGRFVPGTLGQFQRHIFKHPQIYPLKAGVLTDVDITIRDAISRKPVSLLSGISTYCVLKMFEIPEGREFFYLNVSSEKSQFCETNDAHDFSIVLPSAIQLSDEWRVSLHSCILPNSFTSFAADVPLTEHVRIGASTVSTGPAESMHIPKGRYRLSEVVDLVNAKLKGSRLMIDKHSGKARFECVDASSKDLAVILTIGYELAMYLGYSLDDKLKEADIYQNSQVIRLTHERQAYVYRYQPHENANLPQYAMLYSSFIRGMHTADGRSSILKILPVAGDKENVRTAHQFEKNDFRRMNTHVLDRMAFSIRGHDASRLPFLDSSDPVNLTLYFEKVGQNATEEVGT